MTTPLRVDGVDISNYQTGALDLAAAKRAGVRWVFHKATEGTTYRDPWYPKRRAQAKAAGVPFGAYHFARPSGGAADGLAEAKFFLAYATPAPGDMRPMLDFEDSVVQGWSSAQRTAWVGGFVNEVKRQTGQAPFIYLRSGFDLDDHFDCPLWVPAYSDANTQPRIPRPWKRHTVWQFSDGRYGNPNSATGFGHVDLNTMNGDPVALTQAFRLPTAQPTPTSPKPQERPVSAFDIELSAVCAKYGLSRVQGAKHLLRIARDKSGPIRRARIVTALSALIGVK